jgi:signal transduction histidine kinase
MMQVLQVKISPIRLQVPPPNRLSRACSYRESHMQEVATDVLYTRKVRMQERAIVQMLLPVGRAILFAVLYATAGLIGRKIDFVQDNSRVLFPQAGVALAGLIVLGLRYWPSVLVGSLLVTLTARYLPSTLGGIVAGRRADITFSTAFTLAISNTASAVIGALVFLRVARLDHTFGSVRDVYGFLFCAGLVSPLTNAAITFPTQLVEQAGNMHLANASVARRAFGYAISHLIVAPVLMTWSRPPNTRWPRRRLLELVLLVSIFVLVCQAIFTGQSAVSNLNYPISFAPFPFVIWAALRFGPRGACTSTFLVSIIAIYGTSRGYGPFSHRTAPEGLVLLQVYLLAIGLSGLFLASAVAERRTAMAELRASREQLRALSARLETNREEERARLSREIHDELGQQLTGLKIGLKNLRRRLLESTGCPPELVGRFDRLWELADDAVQAVRRIASDLRPGMLDELGLVAALQWQARQFQERTAIDATFTSNVERLELPGDVSTALFRIVQESLTNVAKHANATSVQIELTRNDGAVFVRVGDNGQGFTPPDTTGAHTLGILGMRERARLLGGDLVVTSMDSEITPTPGARSSGTQIEAYFPLAPLQPSTDSAE